MDLIQPTTFCFNYVAYDQNTGLYVAADIYDVTSGTPSFLETVPMSNVINGCYSGNYSGVAGKTYLVISTAFTDNTYTTPATFRSVSAGCYQVAGASVTFYAFGYGAFDMNASLNIRTKIYNVTTGTPVLVSTQVLDYVALGAYFGFFTGTVGQTYEIISTVYTDNTFSIVNPNYSPSGESFTSVDLNVFTPVYIQEATLIGQSLSAVLMET